MSLPPVLQNRLSVPVIGSPLFIISNPDLVIAQCKAGIVGSFPALNARPEPVLEEWLKKITEELDAYNEANPDNPAAPFAVNQIVHKSNDRLMHDVEMCVKYKVPIVITSLGAREDVNEAIHSYGDNANHKAETAIPHGVVQPPPLSRRRQSFPQQYGFFRHQTNGGDGRYQRLTKLECGGCLRVRP